MPDIDTCDIKAAFTPIYYLATIFGIMPLNLRVPVQGTDMLATPACTRQSVKFAASSNRRVAATLFNRRRLGMCSFNFRLMACWVLLIATIIHGISAPYYILITNIPQTYRNRSFVRQSIFTKRYSFVVRNDTTQSLIMKTLFPILITLMSVSARVVALGVFKPKNAAASLKYFFAKLTEADRYLKYINSDSLKFENLVNFRKHKIYGICLCCFFTCFSCPIYGYYLYSISELNNLWGILWCSMLVWSSMTAFCADIIFVFCVYLLRVRYEVINVNLMNIKAKFFNTDIDFDCTNEPNAGFSTTPTVLLNLIIGCKYRGLRTRNGSIMINQRHSQTRNYGRYNESPPQNIAGLADIFEILRYCHRLLNKLIRYLNETYKLHLLMSLSACFLISLFNIYFAMFGYVMTSNTIGDSMRLQTNLVPAIWWNLFYIVRFLMVTGVAHITTRQNMNTTLRRMMGKIRVPVMAALVRPPIKRLLLPLFTKPILTFSRLFAVFPMNGETRISVFGVVHSLFAIGLCVTHLYRLPRIIMEIQKKLANKRDDTSYDYFLKMVFPGAVFLTGVVSKINCLYFLRPNLIKFLHHLGHVDAALRLAADDAQHHRRFSIRVLAAICALTFPINAARLRLFYLASPNDLSPTLLFGDMYFQNVSSCAHEMQFVTLTYGLLLRIKTINRSLRILTRKMEFTFQTKYECNERCDRKRMVSAYFQNVPLTMVTGIDTLHNSHNSRKWLRSFRRVSIHQSRILRPPCTDFRTSISSTSRLTDTLTQLHKLHHDLCDAARYLQKAYKLALLFSLCCLSVMCLFDVYFEFYGFIGGNTAKLKVATYLWCLQYGVRFALIVQICQKWSDEGLKTRHLISSLNNRYLDPESKEELTLFMNHIANTKIEFTACDFFTLNTRLITSAIAAGTTYLVILVQFHSDKDPSS